MNKRKARRNAGQKFHLRANYSTSQRIKFALVLLAAHGLLPRSFAEYLIARGGLRHE